MWSWVIAGGAVVGALVLLVVWPCLVVAARADAAMAGILAALENQEPTHEPDTHKERAYLERAEIWEGLAGWCEEMEGEIAACEVTLAGHPLISVDEVRVNGVPANIGGKADEGKAVIAAPPNARPANQKTKNQKRLLKGMTRAVARDLGLI